MKLAVVVQRYGADMNGGAELHARYIAEHLTQHVDVEVLTTCAQDYVTWRNELQAGEDRVNGVTVRRFPVRRERQAAEFGERSIKVFEQHHSLADELRWLESEGPASPELIAYLEAQQRTYDYFIFFSYRYYHAYHGVRAVPGRAILVPTAERDPAIGLSCFGPLFRSVRAVMYNSFEEQRMIQEVSRNEEVSGVVVGVGSDVPDHVVPEEFRQKFGISGPFAVYVGRIDENKGCPELFDFFQRYPSRRDGLTLVLIGRPIIDVPDHPRIRHLGFLDDTDKFNAIAASEALIMPSYLESLSMVALEAWALGRPVLANGHCDVLKGQCLRSNAGLYYESCAEFAEGLRVLRSNRYLNQALGENGRAYFQRHYAWPVIERKYLDMLQRLQRDERRDPRSPASEPGWLARRRRTVPPASEVLAELSVGPVRPPRRTGGRARRTSA